MTDWFTWLVGVVALAAAAVIGWLVWSLVKLWEFRRHLRVNEQKRERIRESMRAKRPMWHAPDPHHPTEETRK